MTEQQMQTEMTTTTAESYNVLLEKIAKKWFNVETLETCGMDGLDFYDVSVFCMKSALDEAFKAGLEVGLRVNRN
jgi:hypothetical protein